MKKYRCPNCGEESLTWSDKCDFGGRSKHERFNRCPRCHQPFIALQRYRAASNLFILLLLIPLFTFLILTFIKIYFIIAFLLYMIPLAFAAAVLRNALFAGIVQCDQYSGHRIMPYSDAKITLSRLDGKIQYLDIYGIEFYMTTDDEKFREVFTDNLVPLVFLNKKKNETQRVRVKIINREYIPAELLYVGSKFSVLDNGQEIATGEFIELSPPDMIAP